MSIYRFPDIYQIKKGKFACYKIGPLGEILLQGSLNIITDEYVRYILENLSDSCHFPEVIEQTKNSLTIRVHCPDEDDIELTMSLDDFDVADYDTDEENSN